MKIFIGLATLTPRESTLLIQTENAYLRDIAVLSNFPFPIIFGTRGSCGS